MNSASGSLYCLLLIHSFVLAVVTVDKLFLCSPASGARENVSLLFLSLQSGTDLGASHDLRNVASTLSKEEREGEREREEGIDWDDTFPSFLFRRIISFVVVHFSRG